MSSRKPTRVPASMTSLMSETSIPPRPQSVRKPMQSQYATDDDEEQEQQPESSTEPEPNPEPEQPVEPKPEPEPEQTKPAKAKPIRDSWSGHEDRILIRVYELLGEDESQIAAIQRFYNYAIKQFNIKHNTSYPDARNIKQIKDRLNRFDFNNNQTPLTKAQADVIARDPLFQDGSYKELAKKYHYAHKFLYNELRRHGKLTKESKKEADPELDNIFDGLDE